MADIQYAHREDKSCSGWFEFTHSGVRYGHEGIKNLKHYASFDPGAWATSGAGETITPQFDSATSRVYDSFLAPFAGTFTVYRRLRIPRDFGRWAGITLYVQAPTITLITSLGATILRNGVSGDPAVNGASIKPDDDGVWQQLTLNPTATVGYYNPGEFITLAVELTATASLAVFLADWAPLYVTAPGNI